MFSLAAQRRDMASRGYARVRFNSWVESGSQPGRLDQAAASRLDGIGLWTIGDMISSGFVESGIGP